MNISTQGLLTHEHHEALAEQDCTKKTMHLLLYVVVLLCLALTGTGTGLLRMVKAPTDVLAQRLLTHKNHEKAAEQDCSIEPLLGRDKGRERPQHERNKQGTKDHLTNPLILLTQLLHSPTEICPKLLAHLIKSQAVSCFVDFTAAQALLQAQDTARQYMLHERRCQA